MKTYKCSACNWKGEEVLLDKDRVDTCCGSDEIDMCPKCGSYTVMPVVKEGSLKSEEDLVNKK